MPPFGVRILLALLVPAGSFFMMWSEPAFGWLWLLGWLYSYFLPYIEALIRKSGDSTPIGVLNLFAGWTLVGWVVALVWAVRTKEQEAFKKGPIKTVWIDPWTKNPNLEHKVPVVSGYKPTLPDPVSPSVHQKTPETKMCPYCAEEVKFPAIICKHCRSELSA